LRICRSKMARSSPRPIFLKKWLASLYPRPLTFSTSQTLAAMGPANSASVALRDLALNIFRARQIYSPLRRLNLTPTSSSEICAGMASAIMHFRSSRCTAFQQVLALD
jgi:hypothetical protein